MTLTPPEQCRFMQDNMPDFACEEPRDGADARDDQLRHPPGVGIPPYPADDVLVGLEIALY